MGYGKPDALRHYVRKLPRSPGSPLPPDTVFKVSAAGKRMREKQNVFSVKEVGPGIAKCVNALREWAQEIGDEQILHAVPEYDLDSEAWRSLDMELSALLQGEMKQAYNKRKEKAMVNLQKAYNEACHDIVDLSDAQQPEVRALYCPCVLGYVRYGWDTGRGEWSGRAGGGGRAGAGGEALHRFSQPRVNCNAGAE